ncbi:semaphorin receptor binding [Desmophyllum pertusum]|uniref:Semaphorin receptor binding n=1 Tax=Desmophyllum pertusum TaxID=174260 RepID=A0A9X0CXT6_9CNID|nr:semaphorin receptor binding [Desmophyllum pertusum]
MAAIAVLEPTTRHKSATTSPCIVEKVNGGWSKWSDYGSCSKPCGKGKKYQTRTCDNPKPSGGGKDCKGKPRKGKTCNNGKCKD